MPKLYVPVIAVDGIYYPLYAKHFENKELAESWLAEVKPELTKENLSGDLASLTVFEIEENERINGLYVTDVRFNSFKFNGVQFYTAYHDLTKLDKQELAQFIYTVYGNHLQLAYCYLPEMPFIMDATCPLKVKPTGNMLAFLHSCGKEVLLASNEEVISFNVDIGRQVFIREQLERL